MSKSLQIVFLDFDDIKNPLLNAGQARSSYEIAKRLVKKGHSVTIISSRFPGSKDRIEEGITYKHIGLGSNNIRLNNLFYILTLPFKIRNIESDVIIECFTAPISTLCSPLFTKIPVIGKSTSFEADRFAKMYHVPFNLVEKYGSRLYSYFIASTNSSEKKMRTLHPSTVVKVIPEGVADDYFSIQPGKAEYILYLGRLDMNQKGIDLLLEAYKKISKKTSLPLVIAGHGPDRDRIIQKINASGLGTKVKLIGAVYSDKKVEILKHAAVVVLPSRYEGFSLFTLEAFASGLDVIMFDIPGLVWVDENLVKKVKPFNNNAFADHVLTRLEDGIKRRNVNKYKKFANKYTWDSISEQYESFLQEVVEKENSPISNKTFSLFHAVKAKFFAEQHYSTFEIPDTYQLIKKLKSKKNSFEQSPALFLDKSGKKVVIRQIPNDTHTLSFMQVNNEANILKMLSKNSPLHTSGYKISFPKLIRFGKEKDRIFLIREYVEGKPVRALSTEEQKKVLLSVLDAFRYINSSISQSDRKLLGIRKFYTFILTFPIYVFLTILKNPSLVMISLRLTFKYIYMTYSSLFEKKEYVVSHRDLHSKNIIVKDKTISIIDSEIMVRAERFTDLAYILRFWFSLLKKKDLEDIISLQVRSDKDKQNLLRLAIFYSFQLLAMVSSNHNEYRKTKNFLYYLDNLDMRRLSVNNTNNQSSKSKYIDNYRPLIYNRGVSR